MAREVLPVVRRTPVLAGVNGTDPFMVLDHLLDELAALGFSGVQNFPAVGLIDGVFRANLEAMGMGYGLEADLIRAARARDLLTTPYIFSADVVVCHMGLTTGGAVGDETARTLPDCVRDLDAWAEAALRMRRDVIALCHGGPIAMPEDAAYVLKNARESATASTARPPWSGCRRRSR